MEQHLGNPEHWSSDHVQRFVKTFEHGRFGPLAGQLHDLNGSQLLHLDTSKWAAMHPQELAMSLRFTLLGMMQVAHLEDQSGPAVTPTAITTNFVPLTDQMRLRHSAKRCSSNSSSVKDLSDRAAANSSFGRGKHSSKVANSKPKKPSKPKTKPVKFPPIVEFPSVPLLIAMTLFTILTVLCFTCLKQPLENAGVTSTELAKYGSIPLVSIAFTYVHIWVALYMTFYPLEYIGCLQWPDTNMGFGWQGIVPFKGEKMARDAVRIMTTQLMRVKDVFSRIEPQEVAKELEPLMFNMIHEVVEAMALKYNPDLWALLPNGVKEELVEKIKEESPQHIEVLMNELRENIEEVFDLEDMVVTNMLKDKQLLVNMFVTCGYNELAFIRNSGAYMGGVFGVIQMFIWFFYTNRIVVFPIIGLVVGTITNWLALKMIFEPVNPKKIGCITLHGLFLRRQKEVAEVYGRLVAADVLTGSNIIEAILRGPYSDKLFDLVYTNVYEAVNQGTELTEKIMNFSLGSEMYANIKEDVTNQIVEKFPDSLRHIEDYATKAMDLETTLREKMKVLSSEQFENLLHPVFKEDEWKLVVMGGVLGLLLGVFQAFVIND